MGLSEHKCFIFCSSLHLFDKRIETQVIGYIAYNLQVQDSKQKLMDRNIISMHRFMPFQVINPSKRGYCWIAQYSSPSYPGQGLPNLISNPRYDKQRKRLQKFVPETIPYLCGKAAQELVPQPHIQHPPVW